MYTNQLVIMKPTQHFYLSIFAILYKRHVVQVLITITSTTSVICMLSVPYLYHCIKLGCRIC